jgi:hypothetical protein
MKTKIILTTVFMSALLMSASGQQTSKSQAAPVPRNRYAIESNDTSDLLMNEHRFWGIIMEARTAAKGNYRAQISNLERLLFNLEPHEIEQFDNRFSMMMDVAYDYKLWGAAYVISGGCADDCFDYFCQYVIAQGRDRFYATLKDPESCSAWIRSENQGDWKGLLYVASKIYRMKTGFSIPGSYAPEYEMKGEALDEESVMRAYPKLAKKFITKN